MCSQEMLGRVVQVLHQQQNDSFLPESGRRVKSHIDPKTAREPLPGFVSRVKKCLMAELLSELPSIKVGIMQG